jgi:hypothetical protein
MNRSCSTDGTDEKRIRNIWPEDMNRRAHLLNPEREMEG